MKAPSTSLFLLERKFTSDIIRIILRATAIVYFSSVWSRQGTGRERERARCCGRESFVESEREESGAGWIVEINGAAD